MRIERLVKRLFSNSLRENGSLNVDCSSEDGDKGMDLRYVWN